jgi:hypothetical protein
MQWACFIVNARSFFSSLLTWMAILPIWTPHSWFGCQHRDIV